MSLSNEVGRLGFHCHNLDDVEERILGNGFRRGEFFDLVPAELPRLRGLLLSHNLTWSIHTPLVKVDWYPQPPTWSFLCDFSAEKRELTMRMVRLTVEQAVELGAEYIVVHFPTPASTVPGESKARLDELRDIARGSCERLAELSLKSGVPIHVEGVGLSPLLTTEFLTHVLAEYAMLRYCFDVAHTYLAALNDGLDYYSFAKSLRPYLGSVHLWNTRGMTDYRTYRHIPVHPSQCPRDGWVDIPRVLTSLGADRENVVLTFESEASYPVELGNHDYREGIEWVKSLVREQASGE